MKRLRGLKKFVWAAAGWYGSDKFILVGNSKKSLVRLWYDFLDRCIEIEKVVKIQPVRRTE